MAQILKNVDYQIKTSDNPRLWLEIHLTSLLEKDSQKNIDKNIKSNEVNINQNNPKSWELNNIKVLTDYVKNESKTPENKVEINKDDMNITSQNDYQSSDLKEKWELILSKLELPSTRMLLSQQAKLESIDSNEVSIALSPNWENMIKSRKVIIENAIKKVFGDQVNLNFSNQNTKSTNTAKSQEKVIQKLNDNNTPLLFSAVELEIGAEQLPYQYR